MDFSTSVKHVFNNYATFTGRATRSEYWWFQLFEIIVQIVLAIIGFVLGGMFASGGAAAALGLGYTIGNVLSWIFSIAIIVPSLAVFCRRMHDTGRSGWWFFIALIPLIGAIVLLVFCCQKSQPDNQYGPEPKD